MRYWGHFYVRRFVSHHITHDPISGQSIGGWMVNLCKKAKVVERGNAALQQVLFVRCKK